MLAMQQLDVFTKQRLRVSMWSWHTCPLFQVFIRSKICIWLCFIAILASGSVGIYVYIFCNGVAVVFALHVLRAHTRVSVARPVAQHGPSAVPLNAIKLELAMLLWMHRVRIQSTAQQPNTNSVSTFEI